MLSDGSYPGPFSLNALYGPKYPESGFDMKVNTEVARIIKQMSRLKYGRDVNIVNMDISRRSDLEKKEETPQPLQTGFPPIGF
jgi:hypothetical protein